MSHSSPQNQSAKKKIVHVGNYNPYEEDGGIEVVTKNVCHGLCAFGYDIVLLCYSLHPTSTIQTDGYRIISLYCPFKIFELPIPSLKSIKCLMAEIKKADIIHIHYPNPLSTLIASFVAKKYNKLNVVSIHTHIGIDNSSENRGMFYKPFAYINNRFFLRYALKNASKLITPSPAFLLNSKYTSKFENKSMTIANGVDINRFNPLIDKQSIRDRLGIDGKMILFLGSLNSSHKGKGLPVLLSAFQIILEQINNVKLVVVGDGDMKQEYMDYVINIGMSGNVAFTGRVLDDELPNYYAAADVFVLPSIWYESFGIVLIEAMACGTPVVGSNVGGIPYVIGNASYLFQPEDEETLANILLDLLTDDYLAAEVGIKCRERVESKFSWVHACTKMNGLYEQLFKEVGVGDQDCRKI